MNILYIPLYTNIGVRVSLGKCFACAVDNSQSVQVHRMSGDKSHNWFYIYSNVNDPWIQLSWHTVGSEEVPQQQQQWIQPCQIVAEYL